MCDRTCSILAAGKREGDEVRPRSAVGVGGMAYTIGARIGIAADGRAGVNAATDSPLALSCSGRGACQMTLIESTDKFKPKYIVGDLPLDVRRTSYPTSSHCHPPYLHETDPGSHQASHSVLTETSFQSCTFTKANAFNHILMLTPTSFAASRSSTGSPV